MELKEKTYPGTKTSIITVVILLAVLSGILAYFLYTQVKMGREYFINPALYLAIGAYYAILAEYLLSVLTRPRTRICDHFLIDSYDHNVIS
ncbi:MAG: hypothetical protein HXS44_15270 [Theionarchaea archaeon]|nr:hypothetical protein [Theionarchaea archaeon]